MRSVSIPNKLYFRIGEVADLLAIKPYVLRYWETEFPDIRPSKSKSGQRLYKRRDVEMLVRIKELLYNEKFTINGARKRLKDLMREQRALDGHAAEEHAHGGNGELIPDELVDLETPVSKHVVSTNSNSNSNSNAQHVDNRKVFSKIKKDLESILMEFKS